MADRFRKKLPLIIFAAIVGAIVFVVLQDRAGFSMNITEFFGQQITTLGGYNSGLARGIGWGVHLWVCLAWSAIFAVASGAIFPVRARAIRWGAGILVTLLLAKLATMISGPVNQILVSVIGKKGFPDKLPGFTPVELDTTGISVFNLFLAFFSVCYLVLIVFHDLTLPSFVPTPPRDGAEQATAGE